MDTRYFAEPTTRLKSQSLRVGNVIKDMPYPIFLPVVVQTMLDVYAYFSGAERLTRMGADVGHGTRAPGNDQHGDWGLVPASVGLVVIRVAQHVAWDEHLADRDVFSRFKAAHPPGTPRRGCMGGSRFCSIAPMRIILKTGKLSSTGSNARSGTPDGSACTRGTSISLPTPSSQEMTFPCCHGRGHQRADRPTATQ